MLQVTALSKRYGPVVAADGVTFTAAPGEMLGLLGPNGAGKTTTVSMIAGLVKPDAGDVLLDGRRHGGDTDPIKRKVGLVTQDIALLDDLPALDNLLFFASLYDLDSRSARRAAGQALELVGLTDRARDKVRTFSGGMKRRLNLAVALLHDPQIVLLDEPTVGVDPQSRNAIFDNLETLKGRGKTLVYTTHYMEEAERLCDRVVIIDRGKVVANDTLQGLYRLMPASNVVAIELEDQATAPPLDRLRTLPGVASADFERGVLRVAVSDLDERDRAGAAVARGGRIRLPPRPHRAGRPRDGVPGTDWKDAEGLMLRPFVALVWKDLRLFFADRRAVLMSVAAPIVIASFFGFIFGGEGDRKEASRVAMAVVDEDRSAISSALVARLTSDPALAVRAEPLDQARENVRRAKLVAALHVPAGFGAVAAAAFFSGAKQKARLNLLYDPSHATEAAMVQGILAGHVMETVSKEMFTGPTGRESVRNSLTEVEKSNELAAAREGRPAHAAARRPNLERGGDDDAVGGVGRRGQPQHPVRARQTGRDVLGWRCVQRLRARLRGHGRPVHPLHGHRDGRRPAPPAAAGAVEEAAGGAALARHAAGQPGSEHGAHLPLHPRAACSRSPGWCSGCASKEAPSASPRGCVGVLAHDGGLRPADCRSRPDA